MNWSGLRRRLAAVPAALYRAQDGAAAIELALVTPLIGLTILGAVDIAQATAARYDLEQAAQRATELAMVRRPRTDADTVHLVTATGLPAANVAIELHMTCNDDPDDYAAACEGRAARFVEVTVKGKYEPIFNYGPLLTILGGSGTGLSTIDLTASSKVQVQ
jgi:Flp pilus assembly protein TadG